MLHSCSVQTLPWKGAILCKYKTDWLRVATVDGPQPMSIKALFREIFNASLSAKIECMLTSPPYSRHGRARDQPTSWAAYPPSRSLAVVARGVIQLSAFSTGSGRGAAALSRLYCQSNLSNPAVALARPRAFLPPRGQLQQTAGRPLRSSSRSASQACAVLLGEMCNTQSNFPFSSQNAPYVRTAIRSPRAVSHPEAMVRHQVTVAVPKPSSPLVLLL